MRKIQNTNITFRATTDLKQRLNDYCLENDLHNSNVIRQAVEFFIGKRRRRTCPALWRTDNTSSMQPQ